jgi:hydroxymethylpyrimidine pyrophosphatase-like HAD family hydrolase
VEHLGMRPAMIMAIGDNLNDQEMLEYAGSPVVMGNAVSALKTREWPVTATNDECGLAVAINSLLAQST